MMNELLNFIRYPSYMSLTSNISPILFLLFCIFATRQNIWAWVLGLLYVLTQYYYAFSQQYLFSSFSLIIILIIVAHLYGAWSWYQNGQRFFNQSSSQNYSASSVLNQPYSIQKNIILLVLFFVLFLIEFLSKKNIAIALSFLIYALSIVLIADKKIECWILLIIAELLKLYGFHETLMPIIQYHYNPVMIYQAKILLLIYGFIYWKWKSELYNEKIKVIPLSLLLKTCVFSLIYTVVYFAILCFLVYIMGIESDSSYSAKITISLFLGLFYFAFLIISAIILFVQRENFKQWQLFFIANGLFGFFVSQIILSIWY
ncbi:MAG: nicotinamide mononucleotide transporter [Neisseriaceae bacterium]|nr:nicotinamide mononucleotide transporter [Neisseriaceae bacterium]